MGCGVRGVALAAGLAAALAGTAAGPSAQAAAKHRARAGHAGPGTLVIDNRSTHMINGVNLIASDRLHTQLTSHVFVRRENGEPRYSAWLMKGARAKVEFQGAQPGPACLYDVSLWLDQGSFNVTRDLCRDPVIVVTDAQIRLPAPPQAADAPPPPRAAPPQAALPPSPALTPLRSPRWSLIGTTVENGRIYLDPDSVVGDADTRSATYKLEHPDRIWVARVRVRCDRWLMEYLSTIIYSPAGAQLDSVDLVAAGAARERDIHDNMSLDVVAKRVCRK